MTGYCYPETVEEAVAELEARGGEARVIAGGTDVLPDLRKGKIAPRCLVDVTRVPELQRVEIDDEWVTVGAAVTFAAMREHGFLREHVHALVDAAKSVGAMAIQNAATWAGNIVQAMPAADGAIIAIALDAQAQIVSRDGRRWEPVEALFAGPGISRVDPRREVLARLRFPRPRAGTGTAWRRVGRRSALVLPILNCAVRVTLEEDGDRITEAAVALGPVAPRPSRAVEAEGFLEGRSPRPDTLEKAGEIARGEANPRTSVMRASKGYRLDILPTLVSDALTVAVERARLTAVNR
jgi:carbon-monoxide dehydrogenase medium subunit